MQPEDVKKLSEALAVLTSSEGHSLEQIMAAASLGIVIQRGMSQPDNGPHHITTGNVLNVAAEHANVSSISQDRMQLSAADQENVDGIVAEIKRITGNRPLSLTTLNQGGNHYAKR